MSIESFIKNTFSAAGRGIEHLANERARRLSNPAFQTELMNSRKEFVGHISSTASHSLDSAYKLLFRGPGITAYLTTRNLFDSKTSFNQDVLPKIIDEVASLGSSLGQTCLNAARGAGRGMLHTTRWLFAK